jgi:hypothetical protein
MGLNGVAPYSARISLLSMIDPLKGVALRRGPVPYCMPSGVHGPAWVLGSRKRMHNILHPVVGLNPLADGHASVSSLTHWEGKVISHGAEGA